MFCLLIIPGMRRKLNTFAKGHSIYVHVHTTHTHTLIVGGISLKKKNLDTVTTRLIARKFVDEFSKICMFNRLQNSGDWFELCIVLQMDDIFDLLPVNVLPCHAFYIVALHMNFWLFNMACSLFYIPFVFVVFFSFVPCASLWLFVLCEFFLIFLFANFVRSNDCQIERWLRRTELNKNRKMGDRVSWIVSVCSVCMIWTERTRDLYFDHEITSTNKWSGYIFICSFNVWWLRLRD